LAGTSTKEHVFKENYYARCENRTAACGARHALESPRQFFPPRGARCENKITFYIARRVLQTKS
jgi:hypothetical protein